MSRKPRSIGLLSVIGVMLAMLSGAPLSQASPFSLDRRATPSSNCWHTVRSSNIANENSHLLAVDGPSPTDVWAVGTHSAGVSDKTLGEHWDGTKWTVSPTADVGSNTSLSDVAAIGTADVWAVGAFSTYTALAEHWDGTGWFVTSPIPVGVLSELNGVAATAGSDVWGVGFYQQTQTSSNQTLAYHWNGGQWSQVPTPNGGVGDSFLNAVVALSPTDAWAVGQFVPTGQSTVPLAEHWNGSAWTVVPTPQISGSLLTGVTAISSIDVWAVGWGVAGGLILHWDGTSWTHVPSPQVGVQTYLQDVDGTSSNDVWAVGYASPDSESWHTLILHWDGSRWRPFSRPSFQRAAQYFYGVSAIPGGEAWAVGYSLWSGPEITYTQRYSAC
jgi:hypothetical protein